MYSIKAYAKINLFLNVVGQRNDGYHLLESLFIPLKLYDKISLLPDKEITVETKYNNLNSYEPIEDNIVLKVAQKLKSQFNINDGAKFIIEKNIPISAGLGGGSSNAATAIKLLCEHWKINLSNDEQIKFAQEIGADVPFFINCKPSFVEGIGEKITFVNFEKTFFLLLVSPGFAVSTKNVFEIGFEKFSDKLQDKTISKFYDLIFNGKNQLQENAININPQIINLLNELKNQEGCLVSRLSGSGPTCFALFATEKNRNDSYKYFEKSKFWVYSENIDI